MSHSLTLAHVCYYVEGAFLEPSSLPSFLIWLSPVDWFPWVGEGDTSCPRVFLMTSGFGGLLIHPLVPLGEEEEVPRAQFVVLREEENGAGNLAIITFRFKSVGCASTTMAKSATSTHKCCKYSWPPPPQSDSPWKNDLVQLRAKPKLYVLEGISTRIWVRCKNCSPKMAGKGPSFRILISWSHEKDRSLTQIFTMLVTFPLRSSANRHITDHGVNTHGSPLR